MAISGTPANMTGVLKAARVAGASAGPRLALAGIGLAAALGLMIYVLAPMIAPPPPVESTPADRFLAAASAALTDYRFERVVLMRSEDGTGVTAEGAVASAADLAALTQTLQGVEPRVPVTIKTRVAP